MFSKAFYPGKLSTICDGFQQNNLTAIEFFPFNFKHLTVKV